LTYVLGQGRGARLTRSLRDQQQLVQSISAGLGTSIDPGLFVISAVADPQQRDRVEPAILAEITVLRDQGVTDDEVGRAKTLIEMETLVDQHTSRGWASGLGFAATIATLNYHETYLDRVREVTRADVQRAAARYLEPRQCDGRDRRPAGSVRGVETQAIDEEGIWTRRRSCVASMKKWSITATRPWRMIF
jgi:zinc protease